MFLYLDTSSLVKLYVEEEDSAKVADLAEKHALRGFDAIHLASAVTLREELSSPVTFSCSDNKLKKASQREKLN